MRAIAATKSADFVYLYHFVFIYLCMNTSIIQHVDFCHILNFLILPGHASHVKRLMFTEDNKYIISLGSHDSSIFQWRYIPKFPDSLPRLESDADLRAIALKPARLECQFKRRLHCNEDGMTVRLVFDGNPVLDTSLPESRRQDFFVEQLRQEICAMLSVSEDRVRVEMIFTPLFIADVTFQVSPGGNDNMPTKYCALQLMKVVARSYQDGKSQIYLLINRIQSATIMTESQRDGASFQANVMRHDRQGTDARLTYSEDKKCINHTASVVPFSVKLDAEWNDIDEPGAFGVEVLQEISKAALENDVFCQRAGDKPENYFQVLSVHRERCGLVVDMNFINNPPGGKDTEYTDLSPDVIRELVSQIHGNSSSQAMTTAQTPSVLNRGQHTSKVKSIAASTVKIKPVRIPQRLELERAYGYNGAQTCGNMQLLSSTYQEDVDGKNVMREKITLLYASGNMLIMDDCSPSANMKQARKQRFFSEHDEDVTCFAAHPNGYLVVSGDGGALPKLMLWNSDTLSVMKEYMQSTLQIEPTHNDYLSKTTLSSGIESLPTYGALTKQKFVSAQLFLDDAANLVEGLFLKIDQEIMCVQSVKGNSVICSRAMQGTLAGKHANGAEVHVYQPTYKHEQAGGICAVAFTHMDWGARIVSVSANKTHSINVYEVASGKVCQRAEAGPTD